MKVKSKLIYFQCWWYKVDMILHLVVVGVPLLLLSISTPDKKMITSRRNWCELMRIRAGDWWLHYPALRAHAAASREIGRVHCSVLQLSIQCSSILIISREGARRRVESPYPYLLLSKFTHHSYKFFKCESTHRCFQQGKGTIGHIPKMLRISMHDLRGIVRCSLLLVQLWWKWWMLSAQCW